MTDNIELKLDNSLSVFYLPHSKAEVKFIYKEVFHDDCYFQHGIQLNEGGIVVDAGANIGLFALQVLRKAKGIRYFGFEPVPAIKNCLQKNLSRLEHHKDAEINLFRQGLADKPKESEFTFRTSLPGNSTVYSDKQHKEARKMVQFLSLKNVWQWHKGLFFLSLPLFPFRILLIKWWQKHSDRNSEHIKCRLTTLDNFIGDYKLPQIDLLKIDVEGSEFDVLNGASDENLSRIRQIVMEIAPGNKNKIAQLKVRLGKCGFQNIYLDSLWPDSDPYSDAFPCYLYAIS